MSQIDKNNRVVQIIMQRDGLGLANAVSLVKDCRDCLLEEIEEGNICEADDVLMDILGLEPDYIFDLI